MTELEYLLKNKKISHRTPLCYIAYKIKNDICCNHIESCSYCELCNDDELVFSILLVEHKEKIKLTQFEYDIIASYIEYQPFDQDNKTLNNYAIFQRMQDMGYFKGLDLKLKIKDVYKNCEVVK